MQTVDANFCKVDALLFVLSVKYIDDAKRVGVRVSSGCSVTSCLQSWVAKFVLIIMTIVLENLLLLRVTIKMIYWFFLS